ncbi:hypothetical protein F383_38797 [Gossypium arboreum]|uniref:Uncharacterized protein n=1 Tax=Gossypium arboreum TaxID=29729 RepID=A0A0B0MMF9_GOSAR|nr:hypothetical protein F383_38797 [Gossypium arboreum]
MIQLIRYAMSTNKF